MTPLDVQIGVLPATELSSYCEHLLRLDRASRHARFGWAADDNSIEVHCLRVATGASIVVAKVNEVVRGGLEIWPLGDGRAEIVFAVEKEWRNQGLASGLITKAISQAKNQSLRALEIDFDDVDHIVEHLVEKFGSSRRGPDGARGKIAA
jgi:GNAT superfamily N-acetyltransferase